STRAARTPTSAAGARCRRSLTPWPATASPKAGSSASALAHVRDAEGHVAGGNMHARRVDVALLVVEVEIRLESFQESALVEAAEEHRLVHRDVPGHQGAYG